VAREVRLFVPETGDSSDSVVEAQPPNVFSNRIAPTSGSRSGYTVILIDSLFTDAEPINADGTSSIARVRTLGLLRSLPPGEKIAIYAEERKLKVVSEFTSDRDLLERELGRWSPKPDTPGVTLRVFSEIGPPNPLLHGNEPGEAARIDQLQRVSVNDVEMEQVADHLAGIPGRKNLIWLSDKFAISPRAIQKMNDAGVSIYPVNVDGVCIRCALPIGSGEAIAALTGGVYYSKRNDIEIAMREAMDDGRVSYTLGFYPSGEEDRAPVHQLKVSVGRPGVTLRYRISYQREPAPPVSANPVADLLQALNRPIDATAIPIKASITRVQGRLNVEAMLDAGSLGLALNHDLWTGRIEVVARFTTADGVGTGDTFAQTVNLNLQQATYDKALRGGVTYHNEFRIPAGAVELKLLFANPASGKIGTLTIPLSRVKAVPPGQA
jgi:VWFA-related protein